MLAGNHITSRTVAGFPSGVPPVRVRAASSVSFVARHILDC
jgi:hypothetical protein